ncbi:efflux RND transporter periplasmic adaptor subunit [Puteibacter caeruleilacunae]|nr:efflux RND transporter periplasmic adaptor subunit [Puteibacter caeruleilacunae]
MKQYLSPLLIVLAIACTPSQSNEKTEVDKQHYTVERNPVDTIILRSTSFQKELVSNGKLKALRKSVLKFRVGDELEKICVKNGDRIQKGTTIASLNPFAQQQRLTKAKNSLEQAKLELRNKLIGQRYDVGMDNIPEQILNVALIRSGYKNAEEELKSAQHDFNGIELKAPFTGKVANLKHKTYEKVNGGEDFCTLIDDSEFEVEFTILENELSELRIGQEAKVIPYSGKDDHIFRGVISEINPVVEENGLIKAKARIKNPGELMEGMNVKVLVENEIKDVLVVPKSAIVLRQNYEVLFKCKGDTLAWWTYVKTGYENSTQYTVGAHPDKGGRLQAGDTIIVSGNLNLAHESKVEIR